MYELNISPARQNNKPAEMYDLSLDRRKNIRREVINFLPSDQTTIEKRHKERRVDNRPLQEFPFLP